MVAVATVVAVVAVVVAKSLMNVYPRLSLPNRSKRRWVVSSTLVLKGFGLKNEKLLMKRVWPL